MIEPFMGTSVNTQDSEMSDACKVLSYDQTIYGHKRKQVFLKISEYS